MRIERFTVLAWGIVLSSILMHFTLSSMSYAIVDYALIALVSFVAGFILVDIEKVIGGCFAALALCIFVMFVELSLSVYLGMLSYSGFDQVVYTNAIKSIFTAIIPIPIVIVVIMGILGGYYGERFP